MKIRFEKERISAANDTTPFSENLNTKFLAAMMHSEGLKK